MVAMSHNTAIAAITTVRAAPLAAIGHNRAGRSGESARQDPGARVLVMPGSVEPMAHSKYRDRRRPAGRWR